MEEGKDQAEGMITSNEAREVIVKRIQSALVAARALQNYAASRDNSLAITHLEDAEFRAMRDMENRNV